MKGLYLCAFYARHNDYDIVYNDVDEKTKPDLLCDALEVDLKPYDFIIATPPCNFWSHAHSEKQCGEYALKTKHLLPDLLIKLAETGKPFIVENVRNVPRMKKYGIFDIASKYGLYIQFVGRHTYFTNIFCCLDEHQKKDFRTHGIHLNTTKNAQGGENVHKVIENWLANSVNFFI